MADDDGGEGKLKAVLDAVKSGGERQKRPVYRSGRAAPGEPPVTRRERYGAAAPATTGQPLSFIGITEDAYTLECAGCIAWGPPDQLPSVPKKQAGKRVTRVTIYRQVLSLLSPELLALIQDILEMVVAALAAVQPGVTANLAFFSFGQPFIAIEVEVAGRTTGFMVSIQEAVQAYRNARARGATPENAAVAAMMETAAKAGLGLGKEDLTSILGQHGADMLSRAARALGPGDQASRAIESPSNGRRLASVTAGERKATTDGA